MTSIERYGSLAGRVALATVFIASGFGKLTATADTAAYIASKGLPVPTLLALVAGVIELACGWLLVVGVRAREASLLLAAFLVPVTAIFHNPVGLTGMQAQLQVIHVLKNLAIMGGLLTIAARGAGALSVDNFLDRRWRSGTQRHRPHRPHRGSHPSAAE